jgi:hypothetical protein
MVRTLKSEAAPLITAAPDRVIAGHP